MFVSYNAKGVFSLKITKNHAKNTKNNILLGTEWGWKKAKKYPKKGTLKNKSVGGDRLREKRKNG